MADLEIALKVLGPNIAVLIGKTVRSHPGPVKLDVFQIPKEIRELHKQVTLSIDIFYVNKIPFLVTLSRVLCFVTVTHLVDKKSINSIQNSGKCGKKLFSEGFLNHRSKT